MTVAVETPSVAAQYGHTLSLDEVCAVLGISRTTAKRLLRAGAFPIPALPRIGQSHYRFAAVRVDRYLSRAEDGPVRSWRAVAR